MKLSDLKTVFKYDAPRENVLYSGGGVSSWFGDITVELFDYADSESWVGIYKATEYRYKGIWWWKEVEIVKNYDCVIMQLGSSFTFFDRTTGKQIPERRAMTHSICDAMRVYNKEVKEEIAREFLGL